MRSAASSLSPLHFGPSVELMTVPLSARYFGASLQSYIPHGGGKQIILCCSAGAELFFLRRGKMVLQEALFALGGLLRKFLPLSSTN